MEHNKITWPCSLHFILMSKILEKSQCRANFMISAQCMKLQFSQGCYPRNQIMNILFYYSWYIQNLSSPEQPDLTSTTSLMSSHSPIHYVECFFWLKLDHNEYLQQQTFLFCFGWSEPIGLTELLLSFVFNKALDSRVCMFKVFKCFTAETFVVDWLDCKNCHTGPHHRFI